MKGIGSFGFGVLLSVVFLFKGILGGSCDISMDCTSCKGERVTVDNQVIDEFGFVSCEPCQVVNCKEIHREFFR